MRKIGELLAVLFGYVCQYCLPMIGIVVSVPFAGAICTYIVLMETASVIENICAINPAMRNALSKVFDDEKLPKIDGGKGDKIENESGSSN